MKSAWIDAYLEQDPKRDADSGAPIYKVYSRFKGTFQNTKYFREPSGWPKWDMRCVAISRGHRGQCKNRAVFGGSNCRNHGGRGFVTGPMAYANYLIWVMLPESARKPFRCAAVAMQFEFLTLALIQYIFEERLQEDPKLVLRAVDALLQIDNRNEHTDPASLLTHLSEEDAVKTIQILVAHNLIRRPLVQTRQTEDFAIP